MGGHPFSEIPCIICSKTLDLTVDLSSDENGKAVHEACYVERITNQHGTSPGTALVA
jgi:hypothetical protein